MYTLLVIFSSLISCFVSEDPTTTDDPEKQALRYGFQQIGACKNFEKAWLCVRKCLDLDYDVAVADNHCKCKCYTKKDKAKYKSTHYPNQTNKQKWKSGAPTTKLPRWAQTTGKEEDHQPEVVDAPEAGSNEQEHTVYEPSYTTDANVDTPADEGDGTVTDNLAPTSKPVAGNGTDTGNETGTESKGENNLPVAGNGTETGDATGTESKEKNKLPVAGDGTETKDKNNLPVAGNATETESTVAGNGTDTGNAIETASTVAGNGTDTGNATETASTGEINLPSAGNGTDSGNATETESKGENNTTDVSSSTPAAV